MRQELRYDSYGNISLQRRNSGSWKYFCYDHLSRLTKAFGTNSSCSSASQSYSWQPSGQFNNFEGKAVSYNSSTPVNAPSSVSGLGSYTYDANGNMTKRQGNQTLVWDHENRLSRLYGGGKDEYYYYSPDGQRVRKRNSTSNAFYINPMFEVITGDGSVIAANASAIQGLAENETGEIDPILADAIEAQVDAIVAAIPLDAPDVPDFDPTSAPDYTNLEAQVYLPMMNGIVSKEGTPSDPTVEVSGGQIPFEEEADEPEVNAAAINATTVNKYYYFAGQRIAMRENGVFYYLHNDHLGSTYSATNSSGNQDSNQAYYAFGRKRGGTSLPTDNRFTGQKLDTTGLMYYNARYYDPVLGQFISPDTIVPDPGNLLDYNRYMYVRGNALNMTDPSGHCATGANGKPDWNNDGECWGNATWIKNHWNDSDEWGNEYNYWDNLFGSLDIFWDHVANKSENGNDFMKAHRGFYEKAKSAHDSQMARVMKEYDQHNPSAGRDKIHPCRDFWDCPAIALGFASLGTSIAQTGAFACTATVVGAPACGPSAGYLTVVDLGLNTGGTVYESIQYANGNSTTQDLSMSLAEWPVKPVLNGLGIGISATPGVGIAYDSIVLMYDLLIDPFVRLSGSHGAAE